MWVFVNQLGFFSAVEHRDDTSKVMVRARVKQDAERLATAINASPDTILATPDADYAYRLTTTKDVWANLLSAEAKSIDYDNFKNAALSTDDADRSRAYHDVWSAMYRLQMMQ